MQTVTIELLNDKALTLIRQLEQLNIVRLITKKEQETPKRRWAGSISKETAEKMLQSTGNSRDEWERNI